MAYTDCTFPELNTCGKVVIIPQKGPMTDIMTALD